MHPTTHEKAYLAPFIRERALNNGTFGISHTRMPTESRPGHVALIAGFYEDVSAVTKGWKENPVDFDSVFNQTRHTYSYGSPDILPMFSRGASDPERVDAIMYEHEDEDFTKASIELDKFVFDHVDNLFDRAAEDEELAAKLRQNKIIFFLHLLGIDTAGHSYRPYSVEYYDNIKYIDGKIKELEQKVEAFYNDGKTAWVFTADHGMSDWGSHGDGHPDNTRTPIVAWGAGIAQPVKDVLGDHDDFSKPWQLNSVKRNDINQADIASLMAYLVGINYPSNSVGELPLAFLDADADVKAKALFANAMTIIEQYKVKESHTQESHFNFIPFPSLSDSGSTIEERSEEIQNLIQSAKYQEAIEKSEELMKLAIKGLRYLQTYDWLLLKTLVTLGYVGWIGYAVASFLHVFVVGAASEGSHPIVRSSFVLVLAVLCALFYKQNSPINYYLYAIFPVFFWEQIFSNRGTIATGAKLLIERSHSTKPVTFAISNVAFYIAVMEAIVVGYFSRETFSICFGIASVWPWIQNAKVARENVRASLLWGVLCHTLAYFTQLPANKVEDIVQVTSSGFAMLFIGTMGLNILSGFLSVDPRSKFIGNIQLSFIGFATFVTRRASTSLSQRKGLPLDCQILGWICIIGSVTVPFAQYWYPVNDYRWRLFTLFMAFAPTFIILTISYEGFFYISFFAILITWLHLEHVFYNASDEPLEELKEDGEEKVGEKQVEEKKVEEKQAEEEKVEEKKVEEKKVEEKKVEEKKVKPTPSGPKPLTFNEIRISVFFFFLSQIGFFGIGNIASISSFSLDSVYRLIPIFDPFAMGALLIFKILAPFVVLSCTLGILNLRLGVPKSALFASVLALSDILTLNFFYLVVDEGSWLDIGMGISHFSIASLLCLFMIVLEYLSGILVSGLVIDQN